jgi:hypothetical protein
MSARTLTRNAQRRRRTITYSWILALAVIIISLIYFEQTAILYILATLGVTVLLGVVALTDLTVGEKPSLATIAADDARSFGAGVTQGSGKSEWNAKKRS